MRFRAVKLAWVVLILCVVGAGGFSPREASAVEGSLSPEPYCTFEDYTYCYEGCREVYGGGVGTCVNPGEIYEWMTFKWCHCWGS
jgi:hypothetical protein